MNKELFLSKLLFEDRLEAPAKFEALRQGLIYLEEAALTDFYTAIYKELKDETQGDKLTADRVFNIASHLKRG